MSARLRALARPAMLTAALLLFTILFPAAAHAQNVTLDFGSGGEATGRIVQLIALMTILTLAPSILVMVTSFVRIVIVLSLLRTALGTQGTPPNTVVISLALFMTFFIMQPTLEAAYQNGIAPLIDEQITEQQALDRSVAPVRTFMLEHVRELGGQRPPDKIGDLNEFPPSEPLQNTTLAVVATDAALTREQALRVAIMAQDGLARAIRPVHAPMDGDTVFVLSTAARPFEPNPADLTRLGSLAADCVARAVMRGVYEAEALAGVPAYRDLK